MKRTKKVIKYHGRSGRPYIHLSKTKRKYIMVRALDGKGVKRLYEGSLYLENKGGKLTRLKM